MIEAFCWVVIITIMKSDGNSMRIASIIYMYILEKVLVVTCEYIGTKVSQAQGKNISASHFNPMALAPFFSDGIVVGGTGRPVSLLQISLDFLSVRIIVRLQISTLR